MSQKNFNSWNKYSITCINKTLWNTIESQVNSVKPMAHTQQLWPNKYSHIETEKEKKNALRHKESFFNLSQSHHATSGGFSRSHAERLPFTPTTDNWGKRFRSEGSCLSVACKLKLARKPEESVDQVFTRFVSHPAQHNTSQQMFQHSPPPFALSPRTRAVFFWCRM